MRKQTKLVAVLSAAALLAIGASMTSFAATGWQEADGSWVYLDKDGDMVTDTWKKSGNNYFYLGEDGYMLTDEVVEDGTEKYYVDANGAKVVEQWVRVDNDDDEEINGNTVDTIWYYFDANGKAVKGKNKTINGRKYFFNEDGYMISDWYTTEDGDTYYLGNEDEGWAYTGWQLLEPEDSESEAYDDTEWFYFTSAGKAKKDTRAYINKKYYAFDENGVMLNKWIVGTPSGADNAYYNDEIGYQETGWVYVYEKGDDGKINEDGDQYWFYLDSKGMPFNEDAIATSAEATKKDNAKWKDTQNNFAAKMIKGKTYLFNNKGQMQTGVFRLENVERAGVVLNGIYYFNKADGSVNGQMVTGKATVSYDGDDYYYYFDKSGKAYENTIADGVLYGRNGERVNAEDGNSNSAIVLADVIEGDTVAIKGKTDVVAVADNKVIVSSTGKIKKSGTVTIEGIKYTVEDYVVTKEEVK